MRATVSGYSDYSYIYAALTPASDFFTFVTVQSSRRGLAENAPNDSSSVYCHKQRVGGAVSVALLLVTSNQKLRIVIMSGERPAILVGKQEGRAGITTIVNMGSFYLMETSKLLI